MAKLENGNEYLEIKQKTNRDNRQTGVLTSARYEVTSSASQTIINLNFTVTQTTEQKRGFILFIDGRLLREGASNDFTFTNIVNGRSSQVTLNAAIPANLNIIALKIGGYSETLANASSLEASINAINLEIDKKFPNAIINGNFEYWQRNSSFVSPANGSYTADRWLYIEEGSATHTISRVADVPTSSTSKYSMLVDCTLSSVPAAGDRVAMRHKIEGNFFSSLRGKKILLSFWVKATKTGVNCVAFWNSVQNKYLIKEYTVNVSNTWELKTIRFEHDSTGAWLYDNGIGLDIQFALSAGTNWHGTADVWGVGNEMATVNQVNNWDSSANNFQLADVCLIEDNSLQTRTPSFTLAGKNLADELMLCQRYYEKSYKLDVFPGANDANGATGQLSSGTALDVTTAFIANKRITPTAITRSTTTGATGNARDENAGVDRLTIIHGTSDKSFRVINGAAYVSGNRIAFQWEADAEL